ncbi:hypothetical protein ACJX0J_012317, partial [Zea mays]
MTNCLLKGIQAAYVGVHLLYPFFPDISIFEKLTMGFLFLYFLIEVIALFIFALLGLLSDYLIMQQSKAHTTHHIQYMRHLSSNEVLGSMGAIVFEKTCLRRVQIATTICGLLDIKYVNTNLAYILHVNNLLFLPQESMDWISFWQ